MKTYSILTHAEKGRKAIKEGFSWPAFFFIVLWALAKGLFGVAIMLILLWAALSGIAYAIISSSPEASSGISLLFISARVVVGFLANDWLKEKLLKSGFVFERKIEAKAASDAIGSLSSNPQIWIEPTIELPGIGKEETIRKGKSRIGIRTKVVWGCGGIIVIAATLYVFNLFREPHPLETGLFDEPTNWLRKHQLLAASDSSTVAKIKAAKLLASSDRSDTREFEMALALFDDVFLILEAEDSTLDGEDQLRAYAQLVDGKDRLRGFVQVYLSRMSENPDAVNALKSYAKGRMRSKEGAKTVLSVLAKHRDARRIFEEISESKEVSEFGRRASEIYLIHHIVKGSSKSDRQNFDLLQTISGTYGHEILQAILNAFSGRSAKFSRLGAYGPVDVGEDYIWIPNSESLEHAVWVADYLIEEKGDIEAAYLIGEELTQPNRREAVRYLEFAAKRGHPEACYRLYLAHAVGSAIVLYEDNAEKASYWFERAALAGHPEAEREIGAYLIGGYHPSGDGGDFDEEWGRVFKDRDVHRGRKMLESALVSDLEEFLVDGRFEGLVENKYFRDFAKKYELGNVHGATHVALLAQYSLDFNLRADFAKWMGLLRIFEEAGSSNASYFCREYRSEGYVISNLLLGPKSTHSSGGRQFEKKFSSISRSTGWIEKPDFLTGGGSLTVNNTTTRDAIIKIVDHERRAGILFVRRGESTVLSNIADASYALIYALGESYNPATEFFDGSRVDCRELNRNLVFKTSVSQERRNGQVFSVRSFTKQTLTLKALFGNASSKEISEQKFRSF